jgi:hypothetical protein
LFQAKRVWIGQNAQSSEIDGRELIAQISKSIVQQSPSQGRFAASRRSDQKNPFAIELQSRRVEKVKVAAAALQLDGQLFFKAKDKFAVICCPQRGTSRTEDAVTPAPVPANDVIQVTGSNAATTHRAVALEQNIEETGTSAGDANYATRY